MLEIVWAFIKGVRNIFIPVAVGVVALILGLIIGSYTVEFVDAGPDTLRSDYQTIYLQAVAMAKSSTPISTTRLTTDCLVAIFFWWTIILWITSRARRLLVRLT